MSRRWKFMSAFFIGKQANPMMKRLRIIQTPKFGIYLHFIYREDRDIDVHDHPWTFWRIVLKGEYAETLTFNPATENPRGIRRCSPWRKVRRGGSDVPCRAPKLFDKFPTNWAHRITWVQPGTVTLVIVGPKSREWGFWVQDDKAPLGDPYYPDQPDVARYVGRRWVSWTEYLRVATPGREAADHPDNHK